MTTLDFISQTLALLDVPPARQPRLRARISRRLREEPTEDKSIIYTRIIQELEQQDAFGVAAGNFCRNLQILLFFRKRMAFGRKEYGASQTAQCTFCGASAYSKNTQGFLVCSTHKTVEVGPCKCVCGQWLDERDGKYGRFFSCVRCGAMNLRRVKEMNPDAFKVASSSTPPVAKKQSDKLSIYQS